MRSFNSIKRPITKHKTAVPTARAPNPISLFFIKNALLRSGAKLQNCDLFTKLKSGILTEWPHRPIPLQKN